jgi:F0F1-type ATP synthase assembly protein I
MQQVSRMRSRDVADTASALALVTNLGFVMFACVLAGLLAGRLLDAWLQTDPWLTVVLVLAGIGGGMLAVYRMVMKVVTRRSESREQTRDHEQTPEEN